MTVRPTPQHSCECAILAPILTTGVIGVTLSGLADFVHDCRAATASYLQKTETHVTLNQISDAAQRTRNPAVDAFLTDSSKMLFIGGEWVPADSGDVLDVVDPATEDVIARVAAAGAVDVDRAVTAARAAFETGPWSLLGPLDRAKILRRWADLIDTHREELAHLESLNNGMTLATAVASITDAAETVRFFAGGAEHIHGDTPQTDPGSFNYTLRDPIGVCGAIIPWNSPVTNFVWKSSPILAAGNVLIIKPAETTPLTAVRLGELLAEAGLPGGVLNIITGLGHSAGSAISEHPGIDKIAFTGSTPTGRQILAASVSNLKRVSLELGGKSPNIVFDDADLDAAVTASIIGFVSITGQVCLAGTRLFVQRGIHDRFVEAMVKQVSALTVGDPLDPNSSVGPLASRQQLDKVSSYLALGKDEGAVAAVGGNASGGGGKGFFVEPTVFIGVSNDMRIAREEIFGPVLAVIPFDDEEEAIRLANDTEYGLAAAVWTSDLRRAHTVARRIKAGTVWVNDYFKLDPRMPFGGFKQSGIGRDFGLDWYHSCTEPKSVFVTL
ncbi:aldehyde dehydrogenase family protein [Rhodococcus jostii]|uniref:aldehyde dehydrogenase family protein n=2 Tax=Rhodococcus jostii TaxID=132919 RepID=UPI0035E78C65